MAVDSTTTAGIHLQARFPKNFDGDLASGYTLFVDMEWTQASALTPFAWLRRTNGIYAGLNASNQVFVSSFTATLNGSTTITTGRWKFLFIFNGTTVSVWSFSPGGSVVKEIDAQSHTPAGSTQLPGWAAGTRESNNPVDTIHDWCLWGAALPEIHTETLMVAGIPPRQIQPEDLLWAPPLYPGMGDAGPEVSCASPCIFSANLTGAPNQNIAVLRDPSTHAPIDFSGTYYAIGNDSGEATLELYSSTNLTAWTYVEDITSAAGESLTVIGACDFIYDSGATRPYQALYWGESAGDNDIYSISTASMTSRTWTNETNNPIFQASDVSGHASSNGPEDFRVTQDDSGDWVAVFEHNNESPGNMVGIAKNTAARLADAFTYQGDLFDGLEGRENTSGASDIWANPVICALDGDYYCVYEHRSTSNGNSSYMARASDPGDPKSWTPLGGAMAPDALEGGQDTGLFPNGAFVTGGEMHLLTTANQRWIYKGVENLFVGGFARPSASRLRVTSGAASGGTPSPSGDVPWARRVAHQRPEGRMLAGAGLYNIKY